MITDHSEEMAKRRAKELAILKAQNQMLEDAKRNLMGIDDADIDPLKYGEKLAMSKDDKIKAIEMAQEENYNAAMSYYGADASEVDASVYGEPEEAAVRAYERRLKAKGMTDEQMRSKVDVSVQQAQKQETAIPKRRRRRKKGDDTVNETPVEDNKISSRVEVAKQESVNVDDSVHVGTSAKDGDDESYNFDVSSIPDYVQYDVIPLPSNGECYKVKKSRLPVAYLTASDENLIASPNMYRDGKLIDIILKRKILDKDFDVDSLCSGDRDAITLWLRATAYGNDFPITATHPETGKQYSTVVDLSTLKYFDFGLKGCGDGTFEYKYANNVIRFKFFTHDDEVKLRDDIASQVSDSEKISALRNLASLKSSLDRMNLSETDLSNVNEDIDEIAEVIGDPINEDEGGEMYPRTITEQMIRHTVSINGNEDPSYIRGFIENMRSRDAMAYRNYFTDNRPGVNMKVTVNVPESDGGGSFETFLRIDDYVFINF